MHPRPNRPRNCERPTGGDASRPDHPVQHPNEGRIMRILAAALGALLISTSHSALALGGHEQGELQLQQAEPQQAEAPAAETQPAEAQQPATQQAETQPAEAPQPATQQAETQPAET